MRHFPTHNIEASHLSPEAELASAPPITNTGREDLARRAAAKEGMSLLKAYARNGADPNFERYLLADPRTNSIVFPHRGLFTTLEEIEEFLMSNRGAGGASTDRGDQSNGG